MDLSRLRPPAGFFDFHWGVLRAHWLKIAGVPAMIEGALAVLGFLVAIFNSVEAAASFGVWVIRHPIVVFLPWGLLSLWIFLCESHRAHNLRMSKLAGEKDNVRTRAEELLTYVADKNDESARLNVSHKEEIDDLNNELSALRAQLDDRQRIAAGKAVISNLLKLGDALTKEIPSADDSSSVEAWIKRYTEWHNQCYWQINEVLGEAEATSIVTHKRPMMLFNNAETGKFLNYIFWKTEALRELLGRLG